MMMKPDTTIRDADTKVRALTREVATLREDLRREIKRRERAVQKCKQYQDAQGAAEQEAKELRDANIILLEELTSTQEAARKAAESSRQTLGSLQEGLAAVEQSVNARCRQGLERVDEAFSCVQLLHRFLFSPGCSPPVQRALAQWAQTEVSQLLGDTLSALSSLRSSLGGDQQYASSPEAIRSPAAKRAGLMYNSNGLKHSMDSDPEARIALAQAKAQIASLTSIAKQATEEKQMLQKSLNDLEHFMDQQYKQEREAHKRQEEASLTTITDLEAQRLQLKNDIDTLSRRCHHAESSCEKLSQEVELLQSQLSARDRKIADQRAHINALTGALSEQHSDIKSALDLVTRRPTSPSRAARPMSADSLYATRDPVIPQPLTAARNTSWEERQPSMPYYSTPWPNGRVGLTDVDPHSDYGPARHTTREYSAFNPDQEWGPAPRPPLYVPSVVNFPPKPGPRSNQPASLFTDAQHISQLKRDMQSLDTDIAELEASLKSASMKLT